MSVAVAIVVLLAGLCIGATSLGGVFIVPALTEFSAMAPQNAVAASSLAFLFPGLAALASAWHSRSLTKTAAGTLIAMSIGALAGAGLGAATLAWLPPRAVLAFVGLVALVSGLNALLRADATRHAAPPALRPWPLALIAAAVGCGSAWSGTGGPVLLMPALILLGQPIRVSIALAQLRQLPVALAATGANAIGGRLDVTLGISIGLLLILGWFAGMRAARSISIAWLTRLVALALILLAAWLGARVTLLT